MSSGQSDRQEEETPDRESSTRLGLSFYELTPEEEELFKQNHPHLYKFFKRNPNYQGYIGGNA